MTFLIWRLHRNRFLVSVVALAALTALLLITGIQMISDYHKALATCSATSSCGDLSNELFRGDGAIIDIVNLTVVVPLLFGLFWGAPMVAREFEEGTNSLVWAQGVSRKRWLSTQLAWTLLLAALWGLALTLLVSWWRGPQNAMGSRFDAFDIQGIVPVAYSLFAVALGTAVGTFVKRVLPGLAITLAVFAAIRIAIANFVRPHLMAPLRTVGQLGSMGRHLMVLSGYPNGAWVISSGLVGPGGQTPVPIPDACKPVLGTQVGVPGGCLAAHGYHLEALYQPASRFWTFQWYEALIFVGLSVLAAAVSYWWLLRNDA